MDLLSSYPWLNSQHSLLVYDKDGNLDPSTSIPMVDGGTEGTPPPLRALPPFFLCFPVCFNSFRALRPPLADPALLFRRLPPLSHVGFKGNSRVIKPGSTGHCIECMLDLYPPQTTYAMCTIAQRPRLPEHCVMYAKLILWPKEKKDEPIDGDDPDHIRWLFEQAAERAAEFGIKGVNYRLTQGVVKNIIPAVASTNAVIAASCANEAFKIATSCCAYASASAAFWTVYFDRLGFRPRAASFG